MEKHVDQMKKFVNHSTNESAVESSDANCEVGLDSVDSDSHSDLPVVNTPDYSATIENDTAAFDSDGVPEPTKQRDVVTPLVIVILTIIRTNVHGA